MPLFADEKRVRLFDGEERVRLFANELRVELSVASLRKTILATVETITNDNGAFPGVGEATSGDDL
jgi:hypothetical protein